MSATIPQELPPNFTLDRKQVTTKVMQTPGLLVHLAAHSVRWDFIGTAKETGWATDGICAVLLPTMELLEVRQWDGKKPEGKLVPSAVILAQIPALSMVEKKPAETIACRAKTKYQEAALLLQGGKRQEGIRLIHWQMIKGRWPDACFYLNYKMEKGILVKVGERPVGVIIPLLMGVRQQTS